MNSYDEFIAKLERYRTLEVELHSRVAEGAKTEAKEISARLKHLAAELASDFNAIVKPKGRFFGYGLLINALFFAVGGIIGPMLVTQIRNFFGI
jgi:hypothetical protein